MSFLYLALQVSIDITVRPAAADSEFLSFCEQQVLQTMWCPVPVRACLQAVSFGTLSLNEQLAIAGAVGRGSEESASPAPEKLGTLRCKHASALVSVTEEREASTCSWHLPAPADGRPAMDPHRTMDAYMRGDQAGLACKQARCW